MGRFPTGPEPCMDVDSCEVLVPNVTESPFMWALVAYLLFVLLATAGWHLWRGRVARQEKVGRQAHGNGTSSRRSVYATEEGRVEGGATEAVGAAENFIGGVSADTFVLSFKETPSESEGETGTLKMGETSLQYFRETTGGRAVRALWGGVFVMWAALYILVLYGYYADCQVSGLENACFFGSFRVFGSFESNAQFFLLIWFLLSVHVTSWFLLRKKLVNFFRVSCRPETATHVHVTVREKRRRPQRKVSSSSGRDRSEKERGQQARLKREARAQTQADLGCEDCWSQNSMKDEEKNDIMEEEEGGGDGLDHTSFSSALLRWTAKLFPQRSTAKGRLQAFADRLAELDGVREETVCMSVTSVPSLSTISSRDRLPADSESAPGTGNDGGGHRGGVGLLKTEPGERGKGDADCESFWQSESEIRFFLFEGKRFVLTSTTPSREEMTFLSAQIQTPTSCSGLVSSSAKGRSESEAVRLLAVLGPNDIPFKVDSFLELASAELSQFFYIYQVIVYSLWIWSSYLFVGILLLLVACSAAVAKMLVRRSGQVALAEITSFEATVKVKRDGKWVERTSKQIVPGDVVAVLGSHWAVPCDLAILSGTAVVDESALTGESRPVQKTKLPVEKEKSPEKEEMGGREGPAGGDARREERRDSGSPCRAPASDSFDLSSKKSTRHVLFAGTTVMQVSGGGEGTEGEITAVAVATGMQSTKGRLVATMLFPEKLHFKYEMELPIVFSLLLIYALINFGMAIYAQYSSGQPAFWATRFIKGWFTISQILSPMLPVALVVGQIRSSARLRQAGIICVNPGRIAITGKVRVFCFDKTGTLTKDCLDFVGVVLGSPQQSSSLQPAARSPDKLQQSVHVDREREREILHPSLEGSIQAMGPQMFRGLACCHSLATLSDPSGKVSLVGNEVEREMFAATGCELLPEGGGGVAEVKRSDHQVALHGGAGGEKMSLLRRWEFDHTRMTMSVAVFVPLPGQAADLEGHHGGVVPSLQRGEEIGSVEVFCKGSFEAVTSACVPESVPKEAEESFRYFALRGCYVLAMASRSVCTDVKRKEGLSAVKGMSREGVEKGLWWRGLLLFRNELKSDTAKAIREVRAAGIRPVMVTGDTAFCGAFVASASSLWGPLSPSLSVPVNDGTLTVKGGEEREGGEGGQGEGTGERNWEQLLADVEENKEGGGECVVWRSLRSASIAPWSTEEVEESMRSRAASAASAMKGVRGGRRVDALIEIQDLELAVTGRAFDVLKIEGRLGVRSPLLFGLRLFARMSPSQKIEVVEMYRREGLMVGMCGDGGNDCGALRKAHCGVALSEAEASAVAPFTARHKRVGDVVTLLKEGRCALQTSLACYKLIVLYGLLFSVLKIWGFSSGAVMCQMSYVMIDVVAVLGLSYTMSLVGPKTELAKDNRPTSSLLGGMTTSSLVGMWVIDICFLAGAFAAIQQSANYQRFPAEYSDGWAWWTLSDSWEASTLFTVIFAQFVSGAMVFSLGDEFRQAVWRSWPVFSLSLALFGFTLFLILSPSNPLTRLFHTASENFNAPGTDSPAWKAYQEAGHPAADTSMPMEMRGVLAALVIANALALMLWQKIGVEGAFGTAIKTRFPTKRLLIGS